MSRKRRTRLSLTRRALSDIHGIFEYSTARWGKPTAEKYIDDLEAGLKRIQEHPDLLKPEPDLHDALQFYRVNQHVLVCDVHPKSIVVLTVIHASMDILSRLAELEPILNAEVKILHERLRGSGSRKKKP